MLKLDEPTAGYRMSGTEYEEKIKAIYCDATEGIIALQNKLGWYEKNYIDTYAEKWQEIKEILSEVPCSGELITYIESVGLDIEDFEKQYGKEKIQTAVWFAKDLKDRYTIYGYIIICFITKLSEPRLLARRYSLNFFGGSSISRRKR